MNYKMKNSRSQVILVAGMKHKTSNQILLVGFILTSDIDNPPDFIGIQTIAFYLQN
jgi:hypothetical protein